MSPMPIMWKRHIQGLALDSASLAHAPDGQRLYILSVDGVLLALQAHSGKELWRFNFGARTDFVPVIGPDNTVYVGTHKGELHAITSQGSSRWVYRPPHSEHFFKGGAALDAKGILYTGGEGRILYAIDTRNGSLKWHFPLRSSLYSAPVVSSDFVYLSASDQTVYAINQADGSYAWEFHTDKSAVGLHPALGISSVIVGSQSWLYKLNKHGLDEWSYKMPDKLGATPVIDYEGRAYIPLQNGELCVLDGAGDLLWRLSLATGPLLASPVIGLNEQDKEYDDDDQLFIYVGTSDGDIYALSVYNEIFWKQSLGSAITSSLILGDTGILYGLTQNGSVFAIQTDSTVNMNGWISARGTAANTGYHYP